MSKIQAELVKATGVKQERKQGRQEFIAALMVAIAALDDDAWEVLSQEAQDWFNEAADAKNAKKKEIPDFPDYSEEKGEEKEEEKPKARRGAAKQEDAPATPKVGMVAKITTKRGKTSTGTIVEIDDEVVVIKHGDDSEEEFDRDRVESIEVASTGKDAAQDDEPADGPGVGTVVTVTTKRGKEVTGKIVEMDDEIIVLDVDGKDEEFSRDRVESIKAVKSAAKEEAPKASGRRGAAAKEEAPKADEKPKRASNGEVSIGTRIKELIADDLDATEADIAKVLKKEGLEFRENTLKLNYVDAHKFIAILQARKLLKK